MKKQDEEILKVFPEGTWVINQEWNEYQGCSEVFIGNGFAQPFSYLNNYNADDYRVATQSEIDEAKLLYT